MFRNAGLPLSVIALVVFATGCVTDYGGRPGEMTAGEAKMWGQEAAISGFSSFYDGTWSPAVRYNHKLAVTDVTINAYQNPVFAAFSRDGIVDRDGDDIQGNAGSLTGFPATPAGKFNNGVKSVDRTPGAPCEFFANIKQDYTGGPGPGIAFCFSGAVEEIDKDLALQDAFASLDDLFTQIWAGTLASSFTVELASITLNGGAPLALLNPLSVGMTHNGFRPINVALDFSTPGGQELLQTLLDNTVHGEGNTLSFGFAGGLSLPMPVYMSVAFNHDALRDALQ